MLDGWMIRKRGEQWGLKPAQDKANRVEWREVKTGIVFRIEDLARSQSGRGMVLRKFYEAYRGDPQTFGAGLWSLALRKGLYQAKRVYVVADGAAWIWNLSAERFPRAIKQLDFYHASEHLWAVAHALHEDKQAAREWVEPLLSDLRHGRHRRVVDLLAEIRASLASLTQEKRDVVEGNAGYFTTHSSRLDYEGNTSNGCPAGSGAMESTCAQLQDRFKRTGQFWTRKGAASLMALEIVRRNDEWDDCWSRMVA